MLEEDKKAPGGGFSRLALFVLRSCLHDLGHEAAHFLGGVILHLPGGVSIGAEGETGTQHTADGFHVHAVLKGQGCEGVVEVVEADVGQPYILIVPA